MDVVARAWCRGNYSNKGDASPATHRTLKRVRPSWLQDGDAVHYLWPLPEPLTDDARKHVKALSEVASSVVALGWGIDMAVGHVHVIAQEQADALPGERWLPGEGSVGSVLRVPVQGTLDDLVHRHERFLKRLGPGGFTPPPPLSAYRVVAYRRASDPPERSFTAFSLLKPDADGFRPFDTVRRALTVAGMTRGATRRAAEDAGWSEDKVNAAILGHAESGNMSVGPGRFAYLPLPSIEWRGPGRTRAIGAVRRAMVTSFAEDFAEEIAWAGRMLAGRELIDESTGEILAVLSPLPRTDRGVKCYLGPASSWSSVTPVVLPGYDDPAHLRRRLRRGPSADEQKRLLARLHDRIDGLLRKAIVQAGYSRLLAEHAEIAWRRVGFLSGVDLASRYGVPDHLKRYPRLHARLTWRDEASRPVNVPGPVCIGGGRFYGLGLFAPAE